MVSKRFLRGVGLADHAEGTRKTLLVTNCEHYLFHTVLILFWFKSFQISVTQISVLMFSSLLFQVV